MSRNFVIVLLALVLSACLPTPPATLPPTAAPSTPVAPSETPPSTLTPAAPSTSTPAPRVPNFDHIVVIVLENKEYGTVIGNPLMPNFNQFAKDYTLLNQEYAVTHPSLPNYLTLIGGDTFGVKSNCEDCFINAPSLPDLIEASGRTWVTYQEGMPEPCFLGSKVDYVQKHNPFVYFDPIRTDATRCQRSVVPLTRLDADLAAGSLANFVFITPDLCNDAHNCGVDVTDAWLANMMSRLMPALNAQSDSWLIVLTWDEGQGNHSCCGLPAEAGGRVATVLVSPHVKNGFEDETPYSHYSILKTISDAWGLQYLGHAADDSTPLILAPWK